MANNDPVITQAIYDSAKVRVTWTPSGDTSVIGYVISLTYIGQPAGQTAYQSGLISGQTTAFGTLDLPGALNTDVSYLVVVTAMWSATQTGQVSAPLVLPTARPTLISAVYDGAQVAFEWVPSWQAAQGYQLIVYSPDSGTTYSATISDPDAGKGVIPSSKMPNGLSSSLQWQAVVGALGENGAAARSSEGAFPKPLAQPELGIGTIYQAGKRIIAGWGALASTGLTGFRLALTSSAGAVQSQTVASASATSGTLALGAPLSENLTYGFQVIAEGTGGAGVASDTVPVITTIPVLLGADYNNLLVSFGWTMAYNSAVTGFTIQVLSLDSGAQKTADIAGGNSTSGNVTLTSALSTGLGWVCRIIAKGDPATGAISAQTGDTPLPVVPVEPLAASASSDAVSLSWTQLTPAPQAYVATLYSGSDAAAGAETGGTSASLPLTPGLTAPTVKIRSRLGVALGPEGNAVAVIDAAPQFTKLVTDTVTGGAVLHWSAVANASAYLLSFSNGDTASPAGNSYTLPAPLPANAALSVTARAQFTADGVTSTGPSSPAFALASAKADLIQASYDGISVSAAWHPVSGASGYVISVLKEGSPATVDAHFDAPGDASSGTWTYTPSDNAASYSVVVQASFQTSSANASTGPSSAALPLFTAGFFTSTEPASTAYPYLYPATSLANAATPGADISLYLPQIGGATPLTNLPVTAAPFTLEANPNSDTATAWPYRLTLAASSSVWAFDAAPIRATLRAAYIAFLQAAETAGAAPWGVQILQDAISRYMPQTFQEILYYGYGLSFPSQETGVSQGYADLRPGMVLRVIAAPYQTVTQSSSLQWSNGYVGGSVVDYDVGSFIDSSGSITTGTDAFVGQLVAGGALTVNPPPSHTSTQQEGGIADAADMYFAGFRTCFYRLFPPTTLAGASDPCPTNTPSNFVIAAAPSFSALQLASNVPGGSSPVVYFRGRSVLRPCLRAVLNGVQMTVPVGTTVGNLLAQAGRATSPTALAMTGLTLQRGLGAAVTDPSAPLSTAAFYPVRFDWKTQASYGPGWSPLSLPLLPGDIVSTGAA
ncbi:hypothetical protein [Aquimonas sp.]|uniref:hypothetical protein n=1 Tax=Aquimonas sp. TaxID=1872588 RepID=UPI0037C14438